ncbi:MAG: hypothetical protein ACOX7W_03060, partial [Christensenellales bacterium]
MIKKTVIFLIKLFLVVIEFLFLPILLVACAIIRIRKNRIDVGIGINPNINHIRWAKALRKYGYTVETFVVGKPFYITDDFDYIYTGRLSILFPMFYFLKCAGKYKLQIVRMNGGVLSKCVSIIKYLEPQLLRLAGVKTIAVPYGSDCRILERTPNKLYAYTILQDAPIRSNKEIIRKVNMWCKYADAVVGQMDHVDYLPFWNHMRQSLHTIDMDSVKPAYPKPDGNIKIVHIYNHPACKGSGAIYDAIQELKEEGYEIELIFKSGIPNSLVMEYIAKADIVIDQIIIGWYASFATEAMAFGKPVVCFLREDLVNLFEKAG